MIYFENLKEQILKCNDCKMGLEHFTATLEAFKKESVKNNRYRTLAANFDRYNNGEIDDDPDYLFYQYIKDSTKEGNYTLPLSDKESVEINVDFFHPFVVIDDYKYIDPRWHLLVSYCMYLDAAYNHLDHHYCSNLAKLNGWKTERRVPGRIINKTFNTFMEELNNK